MNRIRLSILSLALGLHFGALAQQSNQTTQQATQSREAELQEKFLKQQALLNEALSRNNLPKREVFANGVIREAVKLDQLGFPIYYITGNNIDAAKTISTNKVWPGGSLGLNLTGSGMANRLGIWDGGAVRLTHQEFQGRAVQTDGATDLSDHATHVAGTMVAGGVSANAKGMSYQAPIKCYDWTNDDAEMSAAAGVGMLVSNHSYGQITGWYYNSNMSRWEFYGLTAISATTDYRYGFYDDDSKSIDDVARNNPNYLIFRAAGNDRGNGPSSGTWWVRNSNGQWAQGSGTMPPKVGPYDCISGGAANAKNVITIGAVNPIPGGYISSGQVVMSSFSGWGPTDDGRIKPDVVANGVDVYSAGSASNTNYTTKDGTSMATPNASGSALLIQQHFNNVKGRFMRSSTLKGLIIHTADEAGTTPGPDYSFGWGLMNTAKAVQHINDSNSNMLFENSLNNSSTIQFNIYTDGTKPLRATICWTDISGNVRTAALNDRTPSLVNDLDIRVTRISDNQVFFPFKLNPENPSAAATTGDNVVDNIEQVLIAAPQAGTYTISIGHKKTLVGGAQPFALLISGFTPKPSAAFSTQFRSVCSNSSITFQDQSAGVQSRRWYFPGATPGTSTLANPTVVYPAPGVYPVALAISSVVGVDSVYFKDYITVGGSNLPLIESFEPNSTTRMLWSVQNVGADSTWRFWTTGGLSTGTTSVGINNYDNPTFEGLDRLNSPPLDFRGLSAASLSFKHAYTRYDNTATDSLLVMISTNCGNTWSRLAALGEDGSGNFATAPNSNFYTDNAFVPTTAANWCGGGVGAPCNTLNLSPYVGNANVRIRFEQKGYAGNNLFLDDISITGTLTSNPVAAFYPVLNTTCAKGKLQMLDSSLNQVTSWSWYLNGVLVSTEKNPILSFPTAGSYSVALAVSNANGRDSLYKANLITVLAGPAIPNVSSSKGLVLCNGDSTILSTTASSNFIWFKDSMQMSGQTATSFTTKMEGKYFVRVYDGLCYSQSEVLNIAAGSTPAKPTVTKNLTGNAFCDGGSFTLTSSAAANNQWYRNGIAMDGQTAKTLNYTDSGSFTVEVSDKGCTNLSDAMKIDKLARPNTSEILAKPWAVKGDTITFKVNGSSGSTFAWTATNAALNSPNGRDTMQLIFSKTAASSLVTVLETGSNNCKGILQSLTVGLVNTSIREASILNALQVYPNPVVNELTLEIDLPKASTIQVSIQTLQGQVLQTETWKAQAGKQSKLIPVNALAEGLYIIQFESNGVQVSRTLIKSGR